MAKKTFKFSKIDAFATENSSGNPAAVIWLDSATEINSAQMQSIATELDGFVSEVGYIYKTEHTKYQLKYYSAEREVNFCGHATIAMMYELLANDKDLKDTETISIMTNNGELDIYNRINTKNAVYVMSPAPKFLDSIPSKNDIATALGISPNTINSELNIELINAGLNTLLIPIKTINDILTIYPDIDTLKEFCMNNHIDIIEVFTDDTTDSGNDYRVRVFAATFGYLEDPATGSGNSALGYYLLKNNLWNGEPISLEQNHSAYDYNIVKLQKETDSNGTDRVIFGGGAITRISGEYTLYT